MVGAPGLITLLLCVVASACQGCDPKPDPVPPTPPDPSIGPEPRPPTPQESEEPSCATACERQRKLGCVVGEDTVEGASCEEVCQNSFEAGILQLQWDVAVMTDATECE